MIDPRSVPTTLTPLDLTSENNSMFDERDRVVVHGVHGL